MCGNYDFDSACRKNLREILLNIFSGTSSTPNFSQLSLASVTGPLGADEDNNPTFGDTIDSGELVEGPIKNVDFRAIVYVFKFDTPDEDRKRAKYHIFKLGNKVVSAMLGAPLSRGYPYYVRVGAAFYIKAGCNLGYNFLINKKTYTEYFGAIDGASESKKPKPCSGLYSLDFGNPAIYYFAFLYSKDFSEAILDACISGSVSSFFDEIVIHNKTGNCLDECSGKYFGTEHDNPDCFDAEDASKKLTVSRNKVEKIALRCVTVPGEEKTEICRYVFPVPGKSSKFRWAGLLVNNEAHYLPLHDRRLPSHTRLNDEGKPIKIVIHFIIG
jgi:hypothetical protein